jgi:hypothetical protein
MASFAIAWIVFGVEPVEAPTPVVERDDPVLCGNAVDDPRVPVVQHRGQVGEEDHRAVGLRAERAVGEIHSTGGDGAGRCVLVRGDHVFVCHGVQPSARRASNLLNHTLQIRWQRHAIDLADLDKPKLDHRAIATHSPAVGAPGAPVDAEERDSQSLLLGVLRALRRVQLLGSRQALQQLRVGDLPPPIAIPCVARSESSAATRQCRFGLVQFV